MNTASLPLLYEIAGPIGRITLNRPEKRNALDERLLNALGEALDRADSDTSVRVVTIAGSGKDFSAGMDLAALHDAADAPVLENLHHADLLGGLFLRMRALRKPVVALVHGRALAGGCGIATACDIVLAAESARFGYTEIRLGFVPALVTAILGRNVTEKRAFELIATGDIYSAADVERIGLINHVFPDATFEKDSRVFVDTLAERSPSALWLAKRLLYRQGEMSFDAAIHAGAEVNAIARMTEDTRAGIARFLEERAKR